MPAGRGCAGRPIAGVELAGDAETGRGERHAPRCWRASSPTARTCGRSSARHRYWASLPGHVPRRQLRDHALPGFLLSLLSLFGRDGHQPPIGWGKRIAGIAILVAGILLVLGLLL